MITAITSNGDLGSVDRAAVEALLGAGIIVSAGKPAPAPGMSRRRMIGAGAAVGLVTLVLPSAAAAASAPVAPTAPVGPVAYQDEVYVAFNWYFPDSEPGSSWQVYADLGFGVGEQLIAGSQLHSSNSTRYSLVIGDPGTYQLRFVSTYYAEEIISVTFV